MLPSQSKKLLSVLFFSIITLPLAGSMIGCKNDEDSFVKNAALSTQVDENNQSGSPKP